MYFYIYIIYIYIHAYLGTSPMFLVEILDYEVASNLSFCDDSFKENMNIKAVVQFQATVIGMCNGGMYMYIYVYI
jgi:hypothetical protein